MHSLAFLGRPADRHISAQGARLAIRTGVRIAPKQSAKLLRRNLENSSPEKRISPSLAECVRHKVRKFRLELTSELLDGLAVDDSYGFLVSLVHGW